MEDLKGQCTAMKEKLFPALGLYTISEKKFQDSKYPYIWLLLDVFKENFLFEYTEFHDFPGSPLPFSDLENARLNYLQIVFKISRTFTVSETLR